MSDQINKRTIGLYEKFHVIRTDGGSAPGGKHEHCEYFVLDLTHDPFALPAIVAYANACRGDCPQLAADLMAKAGETTLTEALPTSMDEVRRGDWIKHRGCRKLVTTNSRDSKYVNCAGFG